MHAMFMEPESYYYPDVLHQLFLNTYIKSFFGKILIPMTQELGLVVDLESALKHNPGAQMKLVKDEVKGYRVRQASRRTAEALSAGYWLDILAAHPTEQFLLTAAHAHLNVMLRVYGWPGPADIQVKSMTCASLADHMHRCSHALAKLFDTIRPPEKTSPTRDTFAAWQSPSTYLVLHWFPRFFLHNDCQYGHMSAEIFEMLHRMIKLFDSSHVFMGGAQKAGALTTEENLLVVAAANYMARMLDGHTIASAARRGKNILDPKGTTGQRLKLEHKKAVRPDRVAWPNFLRDTRTDTGMRPFVFLYWVQFGFFCADLVKNFFTGCVALSAYCRYCRCYYCCYGCYTHCLPSRGHRTATPAPTRSTAQSHSLTSLPPPSPLPLPGT